MNAKVRLWHVALIAAGVAVGTWLLAPSAPPDFVDEGFTSVHVELRPPGHEEPVLSASSVDPAVVAGLAEVLRTGRSVMVCRCGALGGLVFRRPDGTAERVRLMPAHDPGAVEFRATGGRFRVSRERFLREAEPLGVPAGRWFEPPAAGVDGAA